jgi:hypothetical protein
MRGRKGTVFEGGTRVPFFVRWPAAMKRDHDVDRIAAHIDIAPTLIEACGGTMPKDRKIDGKSLLPLWDVRLSLWPDRSLFFQWHRAFAVRTQHWRLVQPVGVAEGSKFDKTKLMLFNVTNDPYETKDVAADNPDVVADLKKKYETWFKDVESTRKFAPPRIVIGTDKEPVTTLTRQDWRSKDGNWTPKSLGGWELEVDKAGAFDVTTAFAMPALKGAVLHLKLGPHRFEKKIDEGARSVFVGDIDFPAGPIRLDAWLAEGDSMRGPRFVEVRRSK